MLKIIFLKAISYSMAALIISRATLIAKIKAIKKAFRPDNP